MRVLVCGGRNFLDKERAFAALDLLHAGPRPITRIIQGGANGADYLAQRWANERGISSEEFVAHWQAEGRAAGPLRNQRMISQGKPDLVLAFPGGRGTADMVRRAKSAGIEVISPSPISSPDRRAGG